MTYRLIISIEVRYNCNVALEIRDKARTTRHLFSALLSLNEESSNEEHQDTRGDRQFLGRRRFCRQRRGAEPELGVYRRHGRPGRVQGRLPGPGGLRQEGHRRSEEHTSELQSHLN